MQVSKSILHCGTRFTLSHPFPIPLPPNRMAGWPDKSACSRTNRSGSLWLPGILSSESSPRLSGFPPLSPQALPLSARMRVSRCSSGSRSLELQVLSSVSAELNVPSGTPLRRTEGGSPVRDLSLTASRRFCHTHWRTRVGHAFHLTARGTGPTIDKACEGF
jgi:hypothetical protein